MINGLVRWLVVVIVGLATFWPNWGALWLAISWFPLAPVPVTIAGLAWSIILAIALPFTVHMFRIVTVAAIVLICGFGLYMTYNVNQALVMAMPLWLWAILIVFIAFGWWKIAAPLWRWANGIVAVQQTPEHHSN